jgi:phospholipid/cholesterol/gamma-HCH transport system substrate-binding protein
MFKGNNNLAVGLFVSLAIAFFVGFILWLTGRSGTEELERYSLLFEKDVSGLAIGGPVKYMGVNIGSVIQMEIVRRDKILIRVDIEILESTPVDSGTFASLAFQGITGVAVVNLDSDEGKHEPLKPTEGVPYPVIPVRQLGIAAVLSGAPRIVDQLDSLLIQANELLSEENRMAISHSLENVETLTTSLAGSSDRIADLPVGIEQTLADIRVVVAELKRMIVQVQPDFHSAMSSLNRSTENLANLTAQLDDWMTRNEANLERFVEEGLGEAPVLINAASQTMRDLEKLLARLQEDPSQLIYQPQQESLEIEP